MKRQVVSVAIVGVLTAAGGSAASASPLAPVTPVSRSSAAIDLSAARSPAPVLRSCGSVAASTGVHRRLLEVRLNGPTHVVTGQVFHGGITVYRRPHTGHRAVTLTTAAPALPVIASGTRIVGQYVGLVPQVRLVGSVAPRHPYRFPGKSRAASVLLRGCPTHVTLSHPDRSRRLLPPGRYTLYVSILDQGGYLRSDPFTLTVKPRPRH